VTVPGKMADEYAVLVSDFFLESGFTFRDVSAVVIASVVPETTPTIIELCDRYMHSKPLLIEPGIKTGLSLRIENPQAVGADRIANVVAAHALVGGPAVVLDCGTATKWEALGSGGEYLGGAIAPGFGLFSEALAQGTSLLTQVRIEQPASLIGRGTVHAVQSGLFWGGVGMIEGMIYRMKQELGGEGVRVLATGGLSALFAEEIPAIESVNPLLTLEGLRVLWERNPS
jgi:type III pantothenate kinase